MRLVVGRSLQGNHKCRIPGWESLTVTHRTPCRRVVGVVVVVVGGLLK